MEKMALKLEKRENIKAGALRRKGYVPVVIYNHGKTDVAQIPMKDIKKMFSGEVSESTLINIDLAGEKSDAFVKDYQRHPVTEEVLHIDFYRVTAGEKIKTHIPIHLIGKAAGTKEGGVLEVFLHEVEIETFPRFMVPALEVDISELKIGDAIHANDLKLPEQTRILNIGNPVICHVSVSAKATSEDTPAAGGDAPAADAAPAKG